MKEDFLHFLWRTRRFVQQDLCTTQGEAIQILHPGEHNTHAGADFSNARIRIGETLWAGSVEMHLKSSDWLAHKHQHDSAYVNVILHVVLEEDKPVLNSHGQRLPCLELKDRIPAKLLSQYRKLLASELWIPCQYFFPEVPDPVKSLWLERMLVERLEKKSEAIKARLAINQNNWEETFYQFIARSFGLKVNAEPFETLARSLPQKILAKNRNNLLTIESLLFGQAGFLENSFEEEYPNQLKKEFQFLRQKYGLTPMNVSSWKFLRLHPGNFPTVRLAQFGILAHQSANLFSKVLESDSHENLEKLFHVNLKEYWLTHYHFGKTSEKRNKSLGKSTIRLITINTIAPFLFVYGSMIGDEKFKDKALHLLERLAPESNHIIGEWNKLGQTAKSAAQSQALLQLKNEYCSKKRCLECAIGAAILKP